MWLATRPYHGIVHDSQLYTAQAIAWGDPAAFARDLFFAFGSQDRFTIFSSLYGPLIQAFGPGPAHALMLAIEQALWLCGAWVLASALIPDPRVRLWSLAGLILLPNAFGHLALLRYGEPFVTSRPLVEAATMAAWGLALRGRRVLPVFLMLLALSLHPLIAMPGVGVLALLWLSRLPRLTRALVALAVLLACLPVVLPDGLLDRIGRMDAEWAEIVGGTVQIAMLAEWSAAEYARLGGRLILTVTLLLALTGQARTLLGAAFVVGLLGLLLSGLAGGIAKLHIVIAGQPWRAVWPMLCLGNLLFVPAMLRLRDEGFWARPMERATIIVLTVLMVGVHVAPGLFIALPLPGLLLFWQVLLHRRRAAPSRLALLGMRALLVLSLGWGLAVLVLAVWVQAAQYEELPWTVPRGTLLIAGAVALLAAATAPVRPRAMAAAMLAGAVLLPMIALASHDQRTAWARFVETPGAEQRSLEAFLPREGGVFWDGGLDLVWFRLQRPSYFSCVQGSGVVFFRGTAIAYQERIERFAFQRREGTCSGNMTPAERPATRADLEAICRSETGLDYLVLADRIEGLVAASWTIPLPRSGPNLLGGKWPAGEVYRYDCAALR
ncbi:hypothetical protein [Falsiroseomonas sp. HW251]|uniref:hypothetical protein n=1 Tax=Falsiroseomonas sp. HW251 TaxID=3390998 RepID=UPI003D31A7EC